ncbi:MAG: hypothetical protein ABJ004_13140 [Cyclobacteriaceae bacterium]
MNNKNALILTVLLGIALSKTTAQDALTLGNHIVGGGISFDLSESDNSRSSYLNGPQSITRESSSFNFSPYYGRFIDDYKLLGISLSVGSRFNQYENDDSYPDTSIDDQINFGAGVFMRRYFTITEKVGVYFQPGANYIRSSRGSESSQYTDSTRLTLSNKFTEKEKSNNISLSAKVGFYFFIFDQLTIETTLGNFVATLTSTTYKRKNDQPDEAYKSKDHNSNLYLNLANSFSFDQLFTVNYYF